MALRPNKFYKIEKKTCILGIDMLSYISRLKVAAITGCGEVWYRA